MLHNPRDFVDDVLEFSDVAREQEKDGNAHNFAAVHYHGNDVVPVKDENAYIVAKMSHGLKIL